MCYETSLNKKLKTIEKSFDAKFSEPELFQPWYHISGFVHPNLFCIPLEDPQHIVTMEWGLIAPWGNNNLGGFRKKYNTLNAKSETVLDSRMYQEPARERRCLIIADGFFEPHHSAGTAIPYYCYLEDFKIFTFAGIYNDTGTDFPTVTMLTTEANDFFSKVHNNKKRMPLVLDKDFEGEWLNPDLSDGDLQELMTTAFTQEPFQAHPVTRDLYKRGVDTNIPQALEKEDYFESGNLFS